MNNYLYMNSIYFIMKANSLLFTLKKIPILKIMFNNNINYCCKFMFGIVGIVKDILSNIFIYSFSIYIITYRGSTFIADLFNKIISQSDYILLYISIHCIALTIQQSSIFKITPEDNMFLNHFQLNPKKYYKYKINKDIVYKVIFIIPILYYIFKDLIIVMSLLSIKYFTLVLGHRLFLQCYTKNKNLPTVWKRFLFSFILVIIFFSTIIITNINFVVKLNTFTICLNTVCITLGILCHKSLLNYNNYIKIARKFGNKDVLTLSITLQNPLQSEETVALNKTTYKDNKSFALKHKDIIGYDYLNKVFLERHSHVIKKYYRNKLIFLPLLSLCVGYILKLKGYILSINNLVLYSPIILSIISYISFGEQFSEMLFLHCDSYLLNNHLYKDNKLIYKGFTFRLKYLIIGSIKLIFSVCIGIAIILIINNVHIELNTIISLFVFITCITIFYDTYSLFIYYIIQPYTLEATIKSPFYIVTSWIQTIASILFLFFRHNIALYYIPIAIFTVLFVLFSTYIVRKFGKKSFVIH